MFHSSIRATCAFLFALSACACGDDAAEEAALQAAAPWVPAAPSSDAGMDGGSDAGRDAGPARADLPALCARDRGDKVRDVFCGATAPEVRGLEDLQRLLRTVPADPANPSGSSFGPNALVTLLGHSTALSGHRVSPLNPRMIVISSGVFMAFQRGVQKIELIASARNQGFFNFYLIEFEQACNAKPDGCSAGDLYTPSVERDWLRVRIQDDEELKNTPNDCRQCHQRGSEYPQLLMRELNNPWTHFFQPLPASADQFAGPGVQGHDLLRDYLDAKGDEPYGGFVASTLVGIAPFVLENAVGTDQPVLFDAPGIETERFPYDADAGYPEEPGTSATWQDAWHAFERGEQLALPYVETRVSDSRKQAELSKAYTRYRAGQLSADELPDLSDVFPDDPALRARIGLQTAPDADAQDTLIQACGSCHNNVLDQSISRARFNIDLWKLDRAEIAQAIARIELGHGEPGVMPPPEARQLDAAARKKLLGYLRSDPLAAAPDERLQRAAEMGMAGGKGRRAQR
jgi:mono/diheme cytochrome c family protein